MLIDMFWDKLWFLMWRPCDWILLVGVGNCTCCLSISAWFWIYMTVAISLDGLRDCGVKCMDGCLLWVDLELSITCLCLGSTLIVLFGGMRLGGMWSRLMLACCSACCDYLLSAESPLSIIPCGRCWLCRCDLFKVLKFEGVYAYDTWTSICISFG